MQCRGEYLRNKRGFQDIPVDHFPITFGRDPRTDVCVTDPAVSRYHCQIDVNEMGDGLVVRDLGSRSGTFLNGVPIIEAPVSMGDIITIGMNNFAIAFDADPVFADATDVRKTLRQLHDLWRDSLVERN